MRREVRTCPGLNRGNFRASQRGRTRTLLGWRRSPFSGAGGGGGEGGKRPGQAGGGDGGVGGGAADHGQHYGVRRVAERLQEGDAFERSSFGGEDGDPLRDVRGGDVFQAGGRGALQGLGQG